MQITIFLINRKIRLVLLGNIRPKADVSVVDLKNNRVSRKLFCPIIFFVATDSLAV